MWDKRTVFLESLGCAKNLVDAELMLSALAGAGWTIVQEPENAELVLVNTCGFIKSAKEEAINVSLGAGKQAPQAKVVMTGCLSQRYGEAIESDMGEIAGFFGNRNPVDIVSFVEERLPQGQRLWRPFTEAKAVLDNKSVQAVDTQLPAYTVPNRTVLLGHKGSAYVKVSEGCKNRCTFCAIPLIRGTIRSRSTQEVLSEIQDLLDKGTKEIILIAQDLNAFGKDRGEGPLYDLLKKISAIPGQHWIRPLYVYPDSFDLSILDLFKEDPRLLPYFDIPFQHGAKAVLQAMARPGSAESYLKLIEDIRRELPQAAIRTSILVGFPGETGEDMDALLDFQRQAALEWLGVFSYSPEEGTRAAMLKGRIPQKEARNRQAQVEGAQIGLTATRLDRYVGMVTDVLIEEQVQGEDLAIGRTFFQAPDVDGLTVVHGSPSTLVPGTFVKVRLVRRNGVDMEAYPTKEAT